MPSANLDDLRAYYINVADRPDAFSWDDFHVLHHGRFYFRPSIRPCVVAIDWGAAWALLDSEYRPAPRIPGRAAAAGGIGGSGLILALSRERILRRIWEWCREWYPVLLDGKRLPMKSMGLANASIHARKGGIKV